jgi:hypothetical protein
LIVAGTTRCEVAAGGVVVAGGVTVVEQPMILAMKKRMESDLRDFRLNIIYGLRLFKVKKDVSVCSAPYNAHSGL